MAIFVSHLFVLLPPSPGGIVLSSVFLRRIDLVDMRAIRGIGLLHLEHLFVGQFQVGSGK